MTKPIPDEVIEFLAFLKENTVFEAAWLRDGRPAYGPPETWTHFMVRDGDKTLTVTAETQNAARHLVKLGPVDGAMYVPNSAGRAALRRRQAA